MKKRTKTVICICVSAICVLAVCVMLWYVMSYTLTSEYNDLWIIGKTREQIEERYGRLTEHGRFEGYRLGSMSYYAIEFNSQGTAESVYIYREP